MVISENRTSTCNVVNPPCYSEMELSEEGLFLAGCACVGKGAPGGGF